MTVTVSALLSNFEVRNMYFIFFMFLFEFNTLVDLAQQLIDTVRKKGAMWAEVTDFCVPIRDHSKTNGDETGALFLISLFLMVIFLIGQSS
jgi:hypothetical protein